jgi:hypothetical protein
MIETAELARILLLGGLPREGGTCTVLPESDQISARNSVRCPLQCDGSVSCVSARQTLPTKVYETPTTRSSRFPYPAPPLTAFPFPGTFKNACASYSTMPASTLTGSLSRPIASSGARRRKSSDVATPSESVFPDKGSSRPGI